MTYQRPTNKNKRHNLALQRARQILINQGITKSYYLNFYSKLVPRQLIENKKR